MNMNINERTNEQVHEVNMNEWIKWMWMNECRNEWINDEMNESNAPEYESATSTPHALPWSTPPLPFSPVPSFQEVTGRQTYDISPINNPRNPGINSSHLPSNHPIIWGSSKRRRWRSHLLCGKAGANEGWFTRRSCAWRSPWLQVRERDRVTPWQMAHEIKRRFSFTVRVIGLNKYVVCRSLNNCFVGFSSINISTPSAAP